MLRVSNRKSTKRTLSMNGMMYMIPGPLTERNLPSRSTTPRSHCAAIRIPEMTIAQSTAKTISIASPTILCLSGPRPNVEKSARPTTRTGIRNRIARNALPNERCPRCGSAYSFSVCIFRVSFSWGRVRRMRRHPLPATFQLMPRHMQGRTAMERETPTSTNMTSSGSPQPASTGDGTILRFS